MLCAKLAPAATSQSRQKLPRLSSNPPKKGPLIASSEIKRGRVPPPISAGLKDARPIQKEPNAAVKGGDGRSKPSAGSGRLEPILLKHAGWKARKHPAKREVFRPPPCPSMWRARWRHFQPHPLRRIPMNRPPSWACGMSNFSSPRACLYDEGFDVWHGEGPEILKH